MSCGRIEVVSSGMLAMKFKSGNLVFGFSDPRRGGGYAGTAIVKQATEASKPSRWTGLRRGRVIAVAGCAALQDLRDLGDSCRGARVLVHSGAWGR